MTLNRTLAELPAGWVRITRKIQRENSMGHFMFLDGMYFLYIAPALLLGIWAQFRVSSTYRVAQQQPAALSGAAAARHILDSDGLQDVAIEEIPGRLTDHYDPTQECCGSAPISIAARRWPRWASPPTSRAMPCNMPINMA